MPSAAPTRPRLFLPGTAVGPHLRVERIVRLGADRTYYLLNNDKPKWYTRKCWVCGNKHSPPTAQACTYCMRPLGRRRFLMSARWNMASSLAYQAYVHRRLRFRTLEAPSALYRYKEQLLAVFPWTGERLLLGQASPLPTQTVLSLCFHLADALGHLHNHGVVLRRVHAGNVLLGPSGGARLFDLEVERLSDRPLTPGGEHIRRDLRDLAAMLSLYAAVEDDELLEFLRSVRRGRFDSADACAAAVSHFSYQREGRPPEDAAAALSDAGLVRMVNEDTWGWRRVSPTLTLYCVADGMGGHIDGAMASDLATRTLLRTVARRVQSAPTRSKDLAGLLQEGFVAANQAVYSYATEHHQGMGTTLVALLLAADGRAAVANAGDSRAYLLRGTDFSQITEDHSMVAAMVAAGKISEDEARVHPKKNVLLNFIGSTKKNEPDLFQVEARSGDRILLCSDGLWGLVENKTLAAYAGVDEVRDAVRRLVRAANDAGGEDNITAVLVRAK